MNTDYTVTVPEGQSGAWRIEHFTVSAEDEKFERLRALINGRGRFTPQGTYTRLMNRSELVMSDTPDEVRDHLFAIRQAKGHCQINGLGLGVVLQGMARKPEVSRVTVVEISADVINLVAPHYVAMFGDKIEIIEEDALNYKPQRGLHFGAVWHDIWSTICADNLDDMKRLHRRYGKRADWQGSWSRELIARYAR